METINDVIAYVQKNLVVPKSQYNSFGRYNYRTCEDIVEAVKKLLPDGAYITISDELINVGDRYYVKATAMIFYKDEAIHATALAREPLEKKGMDPSQITGAASSYARKYALNGLLLIDDNKDADSKESEVSANLPFTPTKEHDQHYIKWAQELMDETDHETKEKIKGWLKKHNSSFLTMTVDQAKVILDKLHTPLNDNQAKDKIHANEIIGGANK